MRHSHTPHPPALPLRTAQLIVGALAAFVASVATVVAYLRSVGAIAAQPDVAAILSLVALGVAVTAVPVYLLLRAKAVANIARDAEAARELVRAGRVPPPVQVFAIFGAALAEAAGMLACVALLLGAPVYVFALPVLAIVCIVALIPTTSWLEDVARDAHV